MSNSLITYLKVYCSFYWVPWNFKSLNFAWVIVGTGWLGKRSVSPKFVHVSHFRQENMRWKDSNQRNRRKKSMVVFCERWVNCSTEWIKPNQTNYIWSTCWWNLWNISRPKIMEISFPTLLSFYKTFLKFSY